LVAAGQAPVGEYQVSACFPLCADRVHDERAGRIARQANALPTGHGSVKFLTGHRIEYRR
jgi:hypothetical protein